MISKNIDDWFTSDRVSYDMEVQGNKIRDGVVIFGGKAGPSNSLDNVCHEMGHFVEIDDARCYQDSWGLTMPTEFVPGRYARFIDVPQTFQGCAREIRVFGIEQALCEFFGLERDVQDSAETVYDYVPGSLYLHHEYPEIPDYGCGLSYSELQDIRVKKVAELIREAMAEWPIERIKAEWDRKVTLLEQRAAARMNHRNSPRLEQVPRA